MYNQEKQNLFMASISHELRTPLTSILGYGELLEQTKLNKKQEEYLKRMLNSSKYLLSLVGDFLDIVKFEKNDINKMRDIILVADKQARGKYKWVRVQ